MVWELKPVISFIICTTSESEFPAMSANNWTTCPRCADLHKKAVALSKINLDDSYGHVPLAQYQGAARAHQEMLELSPEST